MPVLQTIIFGVIFTLSGLSIYSQNPQKGVDTQTQKIKEDSSKTTSRQTDATRSFDWGKGKTKVRDLLPNPYRFTARRDALIEMVMQALQEKQILMDEAASRVREGIIITQPFVFAKGAVTTKSELTQYGVVEFEDSAWSRAQYTLTIEVQAIDATANNVSVVAKIEGRSGNGIGSEWRSVPSSGRAEDEFLSKLIELATGKTPDGVVKTLPQ
jgi:hypothetical protein